MSKWIASIAGLLCLSGVLVGEARQAPLRVLFIGNSYTYYNNLPCLVAQLGQSRGRTIETQMIAIGGASLSTHLADPATRAAAAGTWSAVVLQTQSTFGRTYLVDGVDRIADTSSLLRDVRRFVENKTAAGGQLLLYEQWRRRDAPERDQLAIEQAFAETANALGARVIPAGSAWESVRRTVDPTLLFDADGSHPSEAGSYLAALTAYATLTGDSPADLPTALTCPAIDLDTAKPSDRRTTLRVDPSLARRLQQAAAATVAAWRTPKAPSAPPIVLPELPKGAPVSRGQLQGTWVGTTTLYPRSLPWPASLRLEFLAPDSARLTITFGDKPDGIVREVTTSISEGTLEFSDPKSLNGSVARYRAVLNGGELTGIVELTGRADIYGIGTWRARPTPNR